MFIVLFIWDKFILYYFIEVMYLFIKILLVKNFEKFSNFRKLFKI